MKILFFYEPLKNENEPIKEGEKKDVESLHINVLKCIYLQKGQKLFRQGTTACKSLSFMPPG